MSKRKYTVTAWAGRTKGRFGFDKGIGVDFGLFFADELWTQKGRKADWEDDWPPRKVHITMEWEEEK